MKKLVTVAALVLCSLSSEARAGVRVPLYGLLDRPNYASGGDKSTGQFGVGGGLGLEIPLTSFTGLELGAAYVPRKSVVTANYLQIPILFRIWIHGIFTFGGGIHYSQILGNVKQSDGSSAAPGDAGYGKTDFGALANVGFNIPIKGFGLMVEGRYVFGLYNVSAVDQVIAKYDDIQVLLGIRFGSFVSTPGR